MTGPGTVTMWPGAAVVLDDLPCHKGTGVRAAVEAAGCHLRFLPLHSPDLNPIEMAFAKLERTLRPDPTGPCPNWRSGWTRPTGCSGRPGAPATSATAGTDYPLCRHRNDSTP